MPSRAAESIADALGSSDLTLSTSLKEYEDMVCALLRNASAVKRAKKAMIAKEAEARIAKEAKVDVNGDAEEFEKMEKGRKGESRLSMLRRYVEAQRTRSSLFDTRAYTKIFERMLLATWEIQTVAKDAAGGGGSGSGSGSGKREKKNEKGKEEEKERKYHIYSTMKPPSQNNRLGGPIPMPNEKGKDSDGIGSIGGIGGKESGNEMESCTGMLYTLYHTIPHYTTL